MASVTPLLAAWDTAGVVRLYELANGVFVQTGSSGGYTSAVSTSDANGAQPWPELYWANDDTECFIVHAPSLDSTVLASVNALGDSQGTIAVAPAGSGLGPFVATSIDRRMVVVTKVADNSPSARVLDRNGLALRATASVLSGYQRPVLEFSPDLSKVLRVSISNEFLLYAVATPPQDMPGIAYGAQLASPVLTVRADIAKWATDSRTLIIADTETSRAQSWAYDDDTNTWSFINEISLPPGIPQAITISPDARKIAIGTLDGSTARTRIYRRTGSYVIAEQDFDGLGRLLNFTADGALLVDGWTRAALAKQGDETFDVAPGVMAALPVGVRAQDLSQGRTDVYGRPALYAGAVAAFANKEVDLDNLKATFLTSDAVFDRTDASFNEATSNGAWELSTGQWPAGGVVMPNVSSARGDGYFALTSDLVRRVLIESGATFRYAMVYDATNDVPLIFIDLLSERSFAQNREIVLDFRGGEFLRFSI